MFIDSLDAMEALFGELEEREALNEELSEEEGLNGEEAPVWRLGEDGPMMKGTVSLAVMC